MPDSDAEDALLALAGLPPFVGTWYDEWGFLNTAVTPKDADQPHYEVGWGYHEYNQGRWGWAATWHNGAGHHDRWDSILLGADAPASPFAACYWHFLYGRWPTPADEQLPLYRPFIVYADRVAAALNQEPLDEQRSAG